MQHPFFETSQSCVCCIASLSHRFKSSPAIPGNLAVPDAAGYMMTAGHFRRNHESSGDLNRGRRTESRVLFGYFLHDAKSDKPFPFREIRGSANLKSARRSCGFALTKLKPFPKGASRFCKPRISAQNHNFALTKLKPFSKKESRFCKPRFSAPKLQLRTNPIKSFAASRPFRRLRRHFSCCCRNIFSALRRCPCRDSVPCRELFHTFC